jgi:hypothetical protein
MRPYQALLIGIVIAAGVSVYRNYNIGPKTLPIAVDGKTAVWVPIVKRDDGGNGDNGDEMK